MLKLLCVDYDNRLRAYCATARCDYGWYLRAVAGAERNLEIQRGVIKGTKAYATLRADLKRGCVLPPIVLAAKNIDLPPRLKDQFAAIEEGTVESELLAALSPQVENINTSNIYIIDGLQRTNALKQTLVELAEPDKAVFFSRLLRVEVWLNIPFGGIQDAATERGAKTHVD
jgi:hypothetical protein